MQDVSTERPPTSRQEAVARVIAQGRSVSGMLAVAYAFPLPGEIALLEVWLASIRDRDPHFYQYLADERDRHLRAMGVTPPA